jgi:nanoRNase/pAp phosphatase (c-di-AMP/oligoRNAs hydrolase)
MRHIVELSPTVAFVDTVIGSSNQIIHQLLETRATKYLVLMTLFRRANAIFASFRSRNGEALQVAAKFQGGGHANAAGAILPKSVRTVEDGIDFVRKALNPKPPPANLNDLESLFAGMEVKGETLKR